MTKPLTRPGIQAVIFDLGSTLIYFDGHYPDVFGQADQALLEAIEAAGISLDRPAFLSQFKERLNAYYIERDTEFIELTTGYVLNKLLQDLGHPPLPEDGLRQVLRAMYAVFQAYWDIESDAVATLETLKEQGYRLALVSNASDDQDVQSLVDKAGIRSFFEVLISSAAAGIRKPNPQIFLTTASKLNVEPTHIAVVGDRLGADVLGAHNAGMYGILITRRADTAANRAHQDTIHPDAVIDRLEELPAVLQNLGEERP